MSEARYPVPFICPVCSCPLHRANHCLRCERGHSFDIARQGYVSLVTGSGSRPVGDTAAMVQARQAFLGTGVYEPIAESITAAIQPRQPSGLLADLGGGTGWYCAHVLDRIPTLDGVLLDVSSAAAKVAAKAHPRLSVATADLWASIPLADESVNAAMVVFAPRNPAEIYRVLVPGGLCCVVTPGPNHLAELRRTYPMLGIEPEKQARLAQQFSAFRADETSSIEYRQPFSPEDIAHVIGMGPSAFHTSVIPETTRAAESCEVTISVCLHLYIRDP